MLPQPAEYLFLHCLDAKYPNDSDTSLTTVTAELLDAQIGNAPILQLFDNDLMSRKDGVIPKEENMAAPKDMSLKARTVRTTLMSLFPSDHDTALVIQASKTSRLVWQRNFADLDIDWYGLRASILRSGTYISPAEVAKALGCLCLSLAQLPQDLNSSGFDTIPNPQKFSEHCISEIDRLIVHDDEFASTLSGIECQAVLSKYLLNEGRPRKSWLLNRRAIEYAQLAGMHLWRLKSSHPDDAVHDRRLKIWCHLISCDRYLSLILGLPYATSNTFFNKSQINMCLQGPELAGDKYLCLLGIISGKIIDRNHSAEEPGMPLVFSLEQDLEDAARQVPEPWWDTDIHEGESVEVYHERIMFQLVHHVVRAMLHIPLLPKSFTDRRFEYSRIAAVEAAQNGLKLYRILRMDPVPYLCKLSDFFAFMLAMLLVNHLYGQPNQSRSHDKEQDQRNWELVTDIRNILHQAGDDGSGSVAQQSALILGGICRCHAGETGPDHDWSETCKITVPYFGTITVGPGNNFSGLQSDKDECTQHTSCQPTSKDQPVQLSTPPLSNPGGTPSSLQETSNNNSGVTQANMSSDWSQDPMWWHSVDLDVNPFTGFFNELGQEIWPNLDMDLGLDQGWNIDWSGGQNLT